MRLLTLVPIAPRPGLALVVVSALAEGADRLVAEEVLAAGTDRLVLKDVLTAGDDQKIVPETMLAGLDARLEVALPMDAEEYAKDFKTEKSKEEFRYLLARQPATYGRPREAWSGRRPMSEPGTTWWIAATRSSPSGTARSPGAGAGPRKSSATPKTRACR